MNVRVEGCVCIHETFRRPCRVRNWELSGKGFLMKTEAVVERARRRISRALRHETIGSRVALPFDPDDPADLDAWIRWQLATSSSRRYHGTEAYVVRALHLDALTSARKSRRHTARDGEGEVV